MPRIEPIQLLKCLSVLLSPTGGIKSKDELQRLVRLMTKFSKKLVSKCIYIQILKCTETELLGVFMASGGWRLVHMWLTESIVAKNWPLVRELLELLLLCPVDIDRLKTNNCPKLVKELSKDGNHLDIRALASKLVEQWLRTVKGENVDPIKITDISHVISEANLLANSDLNTIKKEEIADNEDKEILPEIQQKPSTEDLAVIDVKSEPLEETNNYDNKLKEDSEKETDALPILKITVKDGKQIISQVDENEIKSSSKSDKSKHKSRDKSSEKGRSSSKSSSSKHSSKSHSSSSDKHKNSSHRSSSSPSQHHSKDRSKDKDKEKVRSSHSSSSKSSKSSGSSRKSSEKTSTSDSKSTKDEKSSRHSSEGSKHREKEEKNSKEIVNPNLDKPSIHKLGKIPKLSESKKEKPSISIEVRKPDEPKPKTVKTFHSKFRSHGLEEEVKPPPSRASLLNKKVLPVLPPTVSIPKRPSPIHNEIPPEKKAKIIETTEKPGAIKLIPAKAKPMLLLESDMFMDALNASATPKKEPKKRKRRTSGSKDGNTDGSPPHTPTAMSSPNSEGKSVPPRFYQDTLDTEEDKPQKDSDSTENNDVTNNKTTEVDDEHVEITEPHTLTVNGLKGVLCYHKRKGPKKTIKWKPEGELEEVQYFELDETERVNVTKTFNDMKNWERHHEREAFQKGRNLSNEDVMEEKTNWRPLIPFDDEGQIRVDYGKNSKERDIQAIRQKGTLQPLYFHKSMIPDSPLEPEPETHIYSEPSIIPLEDVTGNTDNISDFRNMPWPEPKGNAPPPSNTNVNVPAMFQPNMSQFANGFPNPQFPGVPQFQGPNIMPTDWPAGVPAMMGNGLPPGPMGALPPGAMPPGLMVPPDNMMMGPDPSMFGAPNPMFGPVPPEGFNIMENMMGPNMFPPDFNMAAQGPGGPDAFSGGGGFRGAMRGRGAGGNWRGKNSANWDGPPRGRGGGTHSRGGRKAVCIYFQRKGSCRQGDNCTFLHPGVNCPY